jgi:hypothetical protein
VGDMVLLDTKHLSLHTSHARKIIPKRIGPYRVKERIGKVAYRLELPGTLKVHDVFHVSLLTAYRGTAPPQPVPIVVAGEDQYEVHKLVHHRERTRGARATKEYLVIWSGYGPDHNTWEPEEHLPRGLVKQYWSSLAQRQHRSSSRGPREGTP